MNKNNGPRLLKGKTVVERILGEVNEEMTKLKKQGVGGKLVSISIDQVKEQPKKNMIWTYI